MDQHRRMLKTRVIFLCLLASTTVSTSLADQNTIPELDALKKEYDSQLNVQIRKPFDTAVADLNQKYTGALNRALDIAKQAGNLDESLALKNEIDRIERGKGVAERDDAKEPDRLKQLRESYRLALAKLAQDRAKNLAPLNEAYMKHLDLLVSALTKEGKLDQAQAVNGAEKEIPSVSSIGVAIDGKPDSKSIAELLIHKTFRNSFGSTFYFSDNGAGDRTSRGLKLGFMWTVLPDGVAELESRDTPTSPIIKLYAKISDKNVIRFGQDKNNPADVLTLLSQDPAEEQKGPSPTQVVSTTPSAQPREQGEQARKLRLSVFVEDNVEVKISGNNLVVLTRQGVVPTSLKINGRRWDAVWNQGSNEKHTSPYTFQPSLAPFQGGNVVVRKLIGRGPMNVIEQPSPTNGQTLRIQILDPGAGGKDYEISVSW